MNVVRLILTISMGVLISACGSDHEAQAAEVAAPAPESAQQADLSSSVLASPTKLKTALPDAQAQRIMSKISKLRPDLTFISVNATAFPGLFEAEFEQGGVIYLSENGEYFVSGELFKIGDTGIANISEEGRVARRQEILKALDPKDLITFPAEGDDVTDIYVFTDVHCGYCAKLHKDVGALSKLGIRVNYLAFPRGGERSKSYPIMKSIWCSDDRQAAITDAKAGKQIAPVQCDSTTVMDQFELGVRVGVNATPAVMFADGSLELGYKPPSALAALAKSRRK